jgi:hypothetical protein
MPDNAPQFRLRSLTGLALASGFSLIVWLLIAFCIAQWQHAGRPACDKAAAAGTAAAQACRTDAR